MPDISKEQLYIILGVIAVILLGCVIGLFNKKPGEIQSSPESSPVSIQPQTVREQPIYVHLSGAVAKEGVYKLNKGDRLLDLVKISGLTSKADIDSLNLVAVLSDGQKVFIPEKALKAAVGPVGTSRQGSIGEAHKTININLADEKELDKLPGIGPTSAKKIVDYRNEKGQFSSPEELKEVPGISEKKFEKLKALISVY